MATFTLRTLVNAPIDTVFDVAADHRGYAQITPLRSVILEREGDPAPNGVGAIRRLTLVGPPIREEVTEYVRPSRLVYRALSGIPVQDHVGTMEFLQEGGGTRFTWTVTTEPTVPGPLKPVVVAVVRLAVTQLFNAIRKRSAQLAGNA